MDAQLAVLDEKEATAEADKAAFEGTYGATMEESKGLYEKQQAEEIEPMRIPLDDAVAAAKAQITALRDAMSAHVENVEATSDKAGSMIAAEIEAHEEGLTNDSVTQALGEVQRISDEVVSKAGSVDGQRHADLGAIDSEISAFAGKEASNEQLAQLGDLMGRLTSFGMEFDEERQAEMEDMHTSFEQAYTDLTSGLSEAA